MILMLKIAVIGGRETVMGFKALGLDVFPVETDAQAKDACQIFLYRQFLQLCRPANQLGIHNFQLRVMA